MAKTKKRGSGQGSRQLVLATDYPYVVRSYKADFEESGFDARIVSDAEVLLQMLRNDDVAVLVIVGGPLGNWDKLPNASTSNGGRLAAVAAVKWVMREKSVDTPVVFIETGYTVATFGPKWIRINYIPTFPQLLAAVRRVLAA